MMVNSFIDAILEEIAREYHPGVLGWMKGDRPQEWNKMVALEERINETTLKGDMESLKQTLLSYKELILGVVKIFKAPRGQTGNLF